MGRPPSPSVTPSPSPPLPPLQVRDLLLGRSEFTDPLDLDFNKDGVIDAADIIAGQNPPGEPLED